MRSSWSLAAIAFACSAAAVSGCSRERAERAVVAMSSIAHAEVQRMTKDTTPDDAWRVSCDRMCGVHATAPTLDALCAKVDVEATKLLGVETHCEAGTPLGVGIGQGAAVEDAALLTVSVSGATPIKHAFLTLKTQRGWQVARSVGSVRGSEPTTLRLVHAQPTDVPGLEPAAIEARVVLGEQGVLHEREFVCGIDGDGALGCPLAAVIGEGAAADEVEVAGGAHAVTKARSLLRLNAAHLQAAPTRPIDSGWRVELDLTPRGYEGRMAMGDVPDSMRGVLHEHGWGETTR